MDEIERWPALAVIIGAVSNALWSIILLLIGNGETVIALIMHDRFINTSVQIIY